MIIQTTGAIRERAVPVIFDTYFLRGCLSVHCKKYTAGLLDISVLVCYNADNIRYGQPEAGCRT
jgi:hypothetical protein